MTAILTNVKSELNVLLEHDGKWWVASVPSIPGCHTQGKSISQALERIAEAIKLCGTKRVVARATALPQIKITDVNMSQLAVDTNRYFQFNATWTYGKKRGWTTFERSDLRAPSRNSAGLTRNRTKWRAHSYTESKLKGGRFKCETRICPFKQSPQFVADVMRLASEYVVGKIPEIVEWRAMMKSKPTRY